MKERPPAPKITLTVGGVVRQEVPIVQQRTTIGRRPYNAVVIDDLSVSGEHAVLLVTTEGVVIEDLGSTNGTAVNSQQVQRQLLRHGDLIEIGNCTIYFLEGDKENSLPAPLAPVPARLRVVNGAAAGRESSLHKPVTTFGSPGKAMAAVSRRQSGFILSHVSGANVLALNGTPVTTEPVPLNHGDRITLAGIEVEFLLG